MKKQTDAQNITKTIGQPSGKSGRKKLIYLAAAVAVILLIAAVSGGKRETGITYSTSALQKGGITVQVSATGTLEPTNSVSVGSELSGTVKDVYADFNSVVKKGQLLAVIDTTKLSAQATQYRAALETAKASVLQMQATEKETALKYSQLKSLYELTNGQSPSKTELDAAEAAYSRAVANTAGAKASVTQAQAALDANLTDLAKAEIRSPINGVVLNRSIEAGQTVAASYATPELFTIAEDLKKMELHVNVDEADIGQVKEGQKALFTVDAYPDKVFKGVITQARYGSETVDNVVTYETVIQVDNSGLLLRPGMTATSDIIVKELNDVIKIPSAALRYSPPVQEEKRSFISRLMPRPPRSDKTQTKSRDPESVTVYALENGRPVPYEIKVGETDGNFRMMRQGGLKEGMLIITAGTSKSR